MCGTGGVRPSVHPSVRPGGAGGQAACAEASPFAGAGANLAMLDGLELGLVFADAVQKGLTSEEREAAVAAFEEKMCTTAKVFAALSQSNAEATFSSKAPQAMIDMFTKIISEGVDSVVQPA